MAIGDRIVDLAACEDQGYLEAGGTFAAPQLNDFIALGRNKWTEIRAVLTALLAEDGNSHIPTVAMAEATLHFRRSR